MSHLPTGTVTFLFTDIVGSTRLWETMPRAMQIGLATHDQILHSAVSASGGVVFKTVGDAFCVAFSTVSEAVDAAVCAQQLLQEAAWPEGLGISVRMGIHIGAAVSRESDYYGPPLNRVARLLAIAHGGQILLSDVAHDLVRDALPANVTTRSLGDHRLRDLWRPESVFQVCHPALESSFPPLKSLDNPELPNNLPEQLTNFVGREHELALVGSFIEKSRLVTLTGSGGCGKTRLALQVAADLLEEFADGVWLIELAGIRDPSLVPAVVASVLGVRDIQGQGIEQTITNELRQRRVLLLLDNCEHLVDACADFVARLLRSCPHVRVLSTSREHLGIEGELTFRVPSLTLPEIGGEETPESLTQYEAVRLFIERALLHDPSFAVTNANAPAVASICRHLDGIALALELAAAKVPLLSVEEINDRLGERFRLFASGSRTAMPRQQTLRAMIDWSFDLLAPAEQLLFERLSVFEGGWTLPGAESICADGELDSARILSAHAQLVSKSMIQVAESKGGRRYRLLETVRHYALELASQSGIFDGLRGRHLDYYKAFAASREPELTGANQIDALRLLDSEADNLRAALAYGVETNSVQAAQMAASLWRYWEIRGMLKEGSQWLAQAAVAAEADDAVLADVLNGAGNLAFRQGNYDEAVQAHERSLILRRTLGDERRLAASLNNLGLVFAATHQLDRARPLFEESLALRQKADDRRGAAVALFNLGLLARELDDLAGSESLLRESYEAFGSLGDVRGVAMVQSSLGWVQIDLGDTQSAQHALLQAESAFRELGDSSGVTGALIRQAHANRVAGKSDEALRCLIDACEIGTIPESRANTVSWLVQAGALLLGMGQASLVGELVGSIEATKQLIPEISQRDLKELVSLREGCLSALDEQALTLAENRGEVRSIERTVELTFAALRS